MTAIVKLLLLVVLASRYDRGIMESVIAVRQIHNSLPHDLPQVDGYVAHYDCRKIGDTITARRAGSKQWETLLVVDCGGLQDGGFAFLIYGKEFPVSRWQYEQTLFAIESGDLQPRIGIELDYETALRWGCNLNGGCETEILTAHEQRGFIFD